MHDQERRGKSWTRQTLSDVWDATNWEGLRGTPLQMLAPELKLTEKVTADTDGAGPSIAKDCGGKNSAGWAEKIPRVVCGHRGSRSHRRLSGLCSAGIAWKSDQTTQRRMSRTNQNDQ